MSTLRRKEGHELPYSGPSSLGQCQHAHPVTCDLCTRSRVLMVSELDLTVDTAEPGETSHRTNPEKKTAYWGGASLAGKGRG